MEQTAASIIADATAKHNRVILGSSSMGDDLHMENFVIPSTLVHDLPPLGAKISKKRRRPARKIAASPKTFVGAGSRRRLLSQFSSLTC